MKAVATVLAALALGAGVAGASASVWKRAAPLPLARAEVASALAGNEIVVVGGYLAGGEKNTARVDAYSPARNRWRRLPDLPVSVDHAMAASYRGSIYVVGGFGPNRRMLSTAFVLRRGSWRALAKLPVPRAAGAAAIVGDKLYVVGGFGLRGRLAKAALVFDLTRRRWSAAPGPAPRDHLGVAAVGSRLYAVAGQRGTGHELRLVESYAPGERAWRRLADYPEALGAPGVTSVNGALVVVGGARSRGPIGAVRSLDPASGVWRRLANLGTPRHSLALVASGNRLYAIGGGQFGLSVSPVNEFLRLG